MNQISNRWLATLVLIGAVVAIAPALAVAQGYPNKPLKLIVPYGGGGGSVDPVARIVAAHAEKTLGQRIIVENKPGASASIGTMAVKESPPDGYTFLIAGNTFTTYAVLDRNARYDPVRDFLPLTNAMNTSFFILVNGDFPVRSVQELIAFAKSNPGKIRYGSTGVASLPHVNIELFSLMAGIQMTHIPYKGGSQTMPALLSGDVQLLFDTKSAFGSHVDTGRVRALAIASPVRSQSMPNVPSMPEVGLPGYRADIWIGFFAPAGTPADVAQKLNGALQAAIKDPEVNAKMIAVGFEPSGISGEAFAKFIRDDFANWTRVSREVKGLIFE